MRTGDRPFRPPHAPTARLLLLLLAVACSCPALEAERAVSLSVAYDMAGVFATTEAIAVSSVTLMTAPTPRAALGLLGSSCRKVGG